MSSSRAGRPERPVPVARRPATPKVAFVHYQARVGRHLSRATTLFLVAVLLSSPAAIQLRFGAMNRLQRVFSDARSWCRVPSNRPRLVWATVLVALFFAILPELIQAMDFAKYFLLLSPLAACIALVRLMLR